MTESVVCWGAEEPLLTFKCKLVPSVIRAAELRFNTCLHLLQSTLLQTGSILMAADVVPYANWRRKRAQKRFYSAHLRQDCANTGGHAKRRQQFNPAASLPVSLLTSGALQVLFHSRPTARSSRVRNKPSLFLFMFYFNPLLSGNW